MTVRPDLSTLVRKYGGPFSGMLAHVLQRATGVLLLLYLLLHVETVSKLSGGPEAFDGAIAMFKNPLFKLLEIALLATVVLHAMNGVRLTLLDLGWGHTRQRQLFWSWAIGAGVILFLAGAVPMFLFAVLKV